MTRSRRSMLLDVTLSIRAWPSSISVLTPLPDVRRDVGVGQPCAAVPACWRRTWSAPPGRRRRWSSPASRRRARPCSHDRRHHFGAVGGAAQIGRLGRAASRCAIRRTFRPAPAAPRRSRTLSSGPANCDSDHRDGRLAGGAALGSKSTSVPSACFSCENAVIGARRAIGRVSAFQ